MRIIGKQGIMVGLILILCSGVIFGLGTPRTPAGIKIRYEYRVIRSGLVYGNHSLSAVTLGFAWNIGFLSVDYAYRYNLSDLMDLGSHLVTIKLYKKILKKGVK